MKNQTKLRKKLRAWRQSAGLTQEQAAVRIGRSLRTLQDWEQGASAPRGEALTALLLQIDNQRKLASLMLRGGKEAA